MDYEDEEEKRLYFVVIKLETTFNNKIGEQYDTVQ